MVGEAVQLSVAVAFGKVAIAVHRPGAADKVTGAGQAITGRVLSFTVNVQTGQPCAVPEELVGRICQ